ncbi:gly-7, partial [Symbiodinium sp. CCMP2456]
YGRVPQGLLLQQLAQRIRGCRPSAGRRPIRVLQRATWQLPLRAPKGQCNHGLPQRAYANL